MEMHDSPAARTRVLVIDDDPSVRTAIQTILNRRVFDTVLAPDARAGIQSFVSYKFAVVIVDIFLSGMNGLETIVFIRRQAPKIPLIAMSGLRPLTGGGSDLLGIAAEFGATVCLRKPFAPRHLLGAIYASLEQALPRSIDRTPTRGGSTNAK
jgi:DNA-binding response OmpR family regulator